MTAESFSFPPSAPYRLNQQHRDEIYEQLILPDIHGQRRDHPTAVFIAGQPGAGKTTAQAVMLDRLDRDLVVSLDGDDQVVGHPHYPALAARNDRTAHMIVGTDASDWNMRLWAHVREQRFDTIISAPLAGVQWAAEQVTKFRDAGFRVGMVFVATHEAVSQLSIVDRYQRMRDVAGYGRWLTNDAHGHAYEGCVETAVVLEEQGLVDDITIMERGGAVVYENHRDRETGQWTRPPGAAEALSQSRLRPWTPLEVDDFRRKAAALLDPQRRPEPLAMDLVGLINETAAKGEEHIRLSRTAATAAAAWPSRFAPRAADFTTTSHPSAAGPTRSTSSRSGDKPAPER